MLFILVILTAVLLTLPLAPTAVFFWRRHRHLGAPELSAGAYAADHFARRFMEKLHAGLGPAARAVTTAESFRLVDGETVRMVPENRSRPVGARAGDVIYALACLVLPEHTEHMKEIAAEGDISCGAHGLYRALYARGALHLANHCTVLRWCHSDERVTADAGCQLYGRVSARDVLQLRAGCQFVTAIAPVIVCGDQPYHPDAAPIAGACVAAVTGSGGPLIVREALTIPPHTVRAGSVKAYRRLEIGDGCHIGGAIACTGDIHIGNDVIIDGPVIAEGTVTIGTNCRVGERDRPASLVARSVALRSGTMVCGRIHGYEGTVIHQ